MLKVSFSPKKIMALIKYKSYTKDGKERPSKLKDNF